MKNYKKELAVIASSLVLAGAISAPAFAESNATSSASANTGAKIACVGAAVAVREQALSSAMNTYNQALNNAYTARASALATAYKDTVTTQLKSDVKKAWSDFNTATKSARSAWKKSRDNAWSTFRSAAKTCKAPESVSDSGNSSLEASGN